MIDPIDTGWIDQAVRQKYYSYYQNEVVDDPGANALFEHHRNIRFLTATREQWIDNKTWYASFSVSDLRRFGQVDDFACSTIALRPGCLQGFIIYRPWGEAPFAARHRRMLRLFHLWLCRCYKDSLQFQQAHDLIAALPPRVRQTLDLLLAGDSMKQIAAKLGISPHTVNDYMKTLHRRLGVSTRTELLKKCLPLESLLRLSLSPGLDERQPL